MTTMFIVGVVVGAAVGYLTAALMFTAKQADEQMAEAHRRHFDDRG